MTEQELKEIFHPMIMAMYDCIKKCGGDWEKDEYWVHFVDEFNQAMKKIESTHGTTEYELFHDWMIRLEEYFNKKWSDRDGKGK